MHEVTIYNLSIDVRTDQPVLILRSETDGRLLPIWIGHSEAMAILLKLQGQTPPRPLTHDLMMSLLVGTGLTLERVEITRLEEGTFFAALKLDGPGGRATIDARPSDSIALAVRAEAPIFVADDVIESAALTPEDAVDEEEEVERFRAFLDDVAPEDFEPHSG